MKNRKRLSIFILAVLILLISNSIDLAIKEDNKNENIIELVAVDEEISTINTLENDHMIELTENKKFYYSAPKDVFIRNHSNVFKVVDITPILDKPEGSILRILFAGEILISEGIEGEYGLFSTSMDNIKGYVNLGDLALSEETITYGVSMVDKVIKTDDSLYLLAKGEPVTIKEADEGKFTILDDNSSEFLVEDTDVEVRAIEQSANRGSISSRTKSLTKLIASAYRLIGKPYIYGDTGKRGYDCSGLTYSLYLNQLDIKLPRSSSSQVQYGTKVSKSQLIPGDLLFFGTTGKGISHVGLYIGEGNMIHASSGKAKVRIDNINIGYYNQRYITARRIVK